MELVTAATPFAQWLNSFFEGYDYAILDFLNTLAISKAGAILTPVMKVLTLLGEKGILFYLLAAALMIFPKTRRVGVCVFGSVCCGALITNIILKDLIARPRPFEANEVFRSFWDAVGSPAEDGFSFPSGHVTAAAAGMAALCWSRGKKFFLPSVLWVGMMMFCRNYLIAHYPSDVLAGMLIGVFSATVAWLITQLIFRILENNDDIGFCRFLLCVGPGGGNDEDDEEESFIEKRPKPRRVREDEDFYRERPEPRRNAGPTVEDEIELYRERPEPRRNAGRTAEDETESYRETRKAEKLSGFAPRKARSGEYKGRHEK